MSTAAAYPLAWPDAFPRSRAREKGAFRATFSAAIGNVQASLNRFGSDSGKSVAGVVLSSNVTLGVNKPADPGVAVWFTWDGLQVCIPVDCYASPEAKLQAIRHVLEARRTELRHGTLALVRATMKGFIALPALGTTPWWQVLRVAEAATKAEIQAAYRKLAAARHPDTGGSEAMMAEPNAARDEGLKAASPRRAFTIVRAKSLPPGTLRQHARFPWRSEGYDYADRRRTLVHRGADPAHPARLVLLLPGQVRLARPSRDPAAVCAATHRRALA